MEVVAVTGAGHENPQRSRMAFISWLSASLPDPSHPTHRSTYRTPSRTARPTLMTSARIIITRP